MIRKIKGNFDIISETAERFYELSMDIINNKENFEKYSVPFVVNSMLAIELFIKALQTYDNAYYEDTHDLKKLFNKISKNRKKRIKGNYSDMEQFLQEYRKAFIWWRYCFECKDLEISIDEILNTLMALKKECDEIKEGICND